MPAVAAPAQNIPEPAVMPRWRDAATRAQCALNSLHETDHSTLVFTTAYVDMAQPAGKYLNHYLLGQHRAMQATKDEMRPHHYIYHSADRTRYPGLIK